MLNISLNLFDRCIFIVISMGKWLSWRGDFVKKNYVWSEISRDEQLRDI